ncbi:MAG TPA: NYN domain-containing protein, partial [Terriglobales bacterium]|nr:NYN domain-containing protein [Terriglobales bacterium]
TKAKATGPKASAAKKKKQSARAAAGTVTQAKKSKAAASAKTKATARPKKAVAPRRKPTVEPQPAPRPRRAIFIDVENTSSENELIKVFEHLEIDHIANPTEITGIGNWKALGSRFARTLGRYGAQLVHTAPTTGVRDWSDLWIAVNVGRWLARATPGDSLDIVSDDRAFDAIGDAAAASGVHFRRISYRGMSPRSTREAEPAERPRRSRRRRRGKGSASMAPDTLVSVAEVEPPPARVHHHHHTEEDGNHAASQEQIRALLERMSKETGGWVNLDALANTLREDGFTRPPGSPRLMTRLRRMKDVEVLPNGMLRLLPPGGEE